jgi:thioredoxin-related protein
MPLLLAKVTVKKALVSVLLFCSWLFVSAQQDTTPPYKRYPSFPPVDLLQLNNQPLTKKDIPTGRASLVFYFSPDCDHCQHQVKDMLPRMKEFEKVHILMVTHQPIDMLQKFYSEYNLSRYKNIQVGRDSKFLLPPFYKIRSLPYLALYDKKGRLIRTFEGNVKVDVLLKAYSNNL